jgi:hypothetical protein
MKPPGFRQAVVAASRDLDAKTTRLQQASRRHEGIAMVVDQEKKRWVLRDETSLYQLDRNLAHQ